MIHFLLDENITILFKKPFERCDYKVSHVSQVGLLSTPDEKIVEFAANNNFVIVTFDLDFSRIMALSKHQLPSIVTLRIVGITEEYLENIIRYNFSDLIQPLVEGALVTIDDSRIRIKKLPIQKES